MINDHADLFYALNKLPAAACEGIRRSLNLCPCQWHAKKTNGLPSIHSESPASVTFVVPEDMTLKSPSFTLEFWPGTPKDQEAPPPSVTVSWSESSSDVHDVVAIDPTPDGEPVAVKPFAVRRPLVGRRLVTLTLTTDAPRTDPVVLHAARIAYRSALASSYTRS